MRIVFIVAIVKLPCIKSINDFIGGKSRFTVFIIANIYSNVSARWQIVCKSGFPVSEATVWLHSFKLYTVDWWCIVPTKPRQPRSHFARKKPCRKPA